MQERIILAPGCNGTELLRSLAMHGVNTFNWRIMNATELARYALMHSGIAIEEEIISAKEEVGIVEEIIKGNAYFANITFTDVKEIANVLRKMRKLVANDEKHGIKNALDKGIFKEKNNALKELYDKYMEHLIENKQIDGIRLVRKAIEKKLKVDAVFEILDEYPLLPLEEELLQTLSGYKFVRSNLLTLFDNDKNELKNKVSISKYRNCFGASNEVETIIEDIYSNYPLDKCTVAVTDSKVYGQLFFDYALNKEIPITFGTGIPITNSNPANFLKLYTKWAGSTLFAAGDLKALFNSSAFAFNELKDFLAENIGEIPSGFWDVFYNLRLTTDVNINKNRVNCFKKAVEKELSLLEKCDKDYEKTENKVKSVPFLEKMGEELSLTPAKFVAKYVRIRRTSGEGTQKLVMLLDNVALKTIIRELNLVDINEKNVVSEILGLNVLKQTSENGYLHITTIDGALTSLRDNLYVAGLTADKYPGNPKENYLLLDDDLLKFASGGDAETSDKKIIKAHDRFISLIKLAGVLEKKVFLSFPGLDVSELKTKNASSIVHEVFDMSNSEDTGLKFDDAIDKVAYFEPKISSARKIGESYLKRMNITQVDVPETIENSVELTLEGKEYSPSALEVFFECNRRFMFKYVLGINEPDDSNPFEVLSATCKGSLAHSLMEQIANKVVSEADFRKMIDNAFDGIIAQNPPLMPERIIQVKKDFTDMMLLAFANDPHREILLKEEDLKGSLSGIKLHGFPDRVEKLSENECLIVDYKTSRNISHIDEDVDTCLQALIYAFLFETNNPDFKVIGCEYRYLVHNKSVYCSYNDDVKKAMSDKLKVFYDAMVNGEFPVTEDKENCKYCKYGNVCGK